MCLGSSLNCLLTAEGRQQALREMYLLLKTRGILLIDERNFQKLLDERDLFIGAAHLNSPYLYTGQQVLSRWTEITDELLVGELVHKQIGQKAIVQVYPFKRNELRNLLDQTGFAHIKQYSDYQHKDNLKANYYQYVCVK